MTNSDAKAEMMNANSHEYFATGESAQVSAAQAETRRYRMCAYIACGIAVVGMCALAYVAGAHFSGGDAGGAEFEVKINYGEAVLSENRTVHFDVWAYPEAEGVQYKWDVCGSPQLGQRAHASSVSGACDVKVKATHTDGRTATAEKRVPYTVPRPMAAMLQSCPCDGIVGGRLTCPLNDRPAPPQEGYDTAAVACGVFVVEKTTYNAADHSVELVMTDLPVEEQRLERVAVRLFAAANFRVEGNAVEEEEESTSRDALAQFFSVPKGFLFKPVKVIDIKNSHAFEAEVEVKKELVPGLSAGAFASAGCRIEYEVTVICGTLLKAFLDSEVTACFSFEGQASAGARIGAEAGTVLEIPKEKEVIDVKPEKPTKIVFPATKTGIPEFSADIGVGLAIMLKGKWTFPHKFERGAEAFAEIFFGTCFSMTEEVGDQVRMDAGVKLYDEGSISSAGHFNIGLWPYVETKINFAVKSPFGGKLPAVPLVTTKAGMYFGIGVAAEVKHGGTVCAQGDYKIGTKSSALPVVLPFLDGKLFERVCSKLGDPCIDGAYNCSPFDKDASACASASFAFSNVKPKDECCACGGGYRPLR